MAHVVMCRLCKQRFNTEVEDEHEPYMYGDKDTKNFRPDDTIKRGEGALVLTRIFGISTKQNGCGIRLQIRKEKLFYRKIIGT